MKKQEQIKCEVIIMTFEYEYERIFAKDQDGHLVAEVTFPVTNGMAVIDHTFVDESLRGQGVADQLLSAAAGHIRKSGLKAKPTCSYAVRWFSKHPEQSDLL